MTITQLWQKDCYGWFSVSLHLFFMRSSTFCNRNDEKTNIDHE